MEYITEWQCDTCRTIYPSENEASLCENRHKQAATRQAAYHTAQASGKPMIGLFRKSESGQLVLYGVTAVLGKAESRNSQQSGWRNTEDEVRYRFSDSCNTWEAFLPEGEYRRYLSIQEAVEAGWCPFFAPHYQQAFPLVLREQIADAFLALPEEVQKTNLLARKLMTRSYDED